MRIDLRGATIPFMGGIFVALDTDETGTSNLSLPFMGGVFIAAPFENPQSAVPTTDVAAGQWIPTTGTTLVENISEITQDDTTFIATNRASACEVALPSVTDPETGEDHSVEYRIAANSGGITVRLRQGTTTTIAEWVHATVPTVLTTFEQTLTAGQADSITDYTDLRLQFEAT